MHKAKPKDRKSGFAILRFSARATIFLNVVLTLASPWPRLTDLNGQCSITIILGFSICGVDLGQNVWQYTGLTWSSVGMIRFFKLLSSLYKTCLYFPDLAKTRMPFWYATLSIRKQHYTLCRFTLYSRLEWLFIFVEFWEEAGTLLENPAENNLIKFFCTGYKAEILCHCRKICYS